MSDESDETRVSPFGDAEGRRSPEPGRPDDTLPDGPPPARPDDATKVTPRSDATSVMPPTSGGQADSDDWARSRANPVWSGRAEVRRPQPGRSGYDTDWSDVSIPVGEPDRRDRWWMPIVVGIVVLVLLGVLAWAIYVIVQNAGEDQTPATTPTTTTAAVSTAPSSEPTTTTASAPPTTAEPTTTEPTTTEILVPALRGLALADARAALDRTGLRYRVLYRNSTAPAGTVIDSDPAEGQEVPPDTRVTIVVSQQGGAAPTTTTTSTAPATAGN
jgi:pyruvate/2-oxoglutarate dehydrogenase complex dihydrolipoamide acyltransferase (E2) component